MAYQRKTRDEFTLQGDYGYGWEDLTCEITFKEIRQQKKAYDIDEPYIMHKIIKRRVKVDLSNGNE